MKATRLPHGAHLNAALERNQDWMNDPTLAQWDGSFLEMMMAEWKEARSDKMFCDWMRELSPSEYAAWYKKWAEAD